jgi:uncharacterized delta-60 repeat protein
MKTKSLILTLLAAGFAGGARAEFTVTGPPGLDANSDVSTLPVAPLAPLFEQMPLNNRLDMSLVFTNRTGALQTFTGGTVTFRNAAGAVIRTDALSAKEFVKRRTLSTGGTFASGPLLLQVTDYDKETLTAVKWTPAGGLVAAGWARQVSSGTEKFIVMKMLLDGTLDASFAGDGIKAGPEGRANALAIQSDGKVILAGTNGTDFVVQRYLTDGEGDDDFGFDGGVTTALGADAEAHGVAVDAQGRVVVAGRVKNGAAWRLAIVRYMPDGTLDTTFSGDGIQINDLAASSTESIHGLVVDGSNRPVVTGEGRVGGLRQLLVARYRSTGVLDTGFSGDGVVLSGLAGTDEAAGRAVALDAGGRIVVSGEAWIGTSQRFALARFIAAGVSTGIFDPTFDGDGQVLTDFPETDDERAGAVGLDAAGNILSVGHARDTETDFLAVTTHTSAGALLPAFAFDGKLEVEVKDGDDPAESFTGCAVAPLLLGDFIAAGTAVLADETSRWVLARFHSDGTPYTQATVPENAVVTLEMADFPYFTDIDEEPFDGFDPKSTPASMDIELEFHGIAQPMRVSGIALRPFSQNARAYRYPLHDPDVAGASWIAGGGHESGTPHGNIGAQRFHWDVSAATATSSLRPGVDPMVLQEFWEDHDNYDATRSYTAEELPNAKIAWGQPVYAMAAGKVVRSANDREDNFPNGDKTFGTGAGNSVVIDHGNGEFGVYAHMQKGSVTVEAGDMVSMGDPLGVVGNSGSSSGPHLHFGLVDDPGTTSWGTSQSVPLYFMDAKFPVVPGGTPVRQLRAAPRDGEVITIDATSIPFLSPGPSYGPGPVNEIAGVHDAVAAPMRLTLPVTLQGSIGSTPGMAMADGGDMIEDVYRFTVVEDSTVWVRLEFTAPHDLDLLLYNHQLQAIEPAAGKTLARPETFHANVSAGVYYLFVTRYDPSGNAPVNYTLQAGAWVGGRNIHVDWYSACPQPFGNPACVGGYGGPFPRLSQAHDVTFPGCRIFIKAGTYPEKITLRNPAVIRAHDGSAIVTP